VRVNLLLHLCLLVQQLLHRRFVHGLGELFRDPVEAVQKTPLGRNSQLHVAAHVERGVELGFLGQVPDAGTPGCPGLALEVLVHPRHDAQQARLAGPVGPEDADLRVGVE
jgi:hypothetical protein